MPTTMTTVSSILKEVYEGQVQEQLNNDVVALRRIERSAEGITHEVGGRYVTFPIHTRRNSGIGARNEMETLPTPGQQGYNAARVSLKYLYGSVRLSGQTLKLADKNFQAFASALDLEMSGLKSDLAKDLNRQVYGTGSGVFATADAAGTASAGANVFKCGTSNDVKWVTLGMVVDIYASDLTTLIVAGRTVNSIDLVAFDIGFDGASQATAATQVMVRAGSISREITGLGTIVGSGNAYNITVASEPVWQSVLDSNGGTPRALSEGLMIANTDKCRSNGASPSLLLTGLGVRRAYFNLLTQQRRFTNTVEFDGGFKGLAFTTDQGDIPLVVDVDCPDRTMYGLSEKNLKVYEESDWSFMDYDGSKWIRVQGVDAYDATSFKYMELGTHRRNAHFKITDIIEG